MKSIRSYLLSRILIGSSFALTAAGVLVYLVVARSLEAQFDGNLTDRVQALASILFQTEERVDFAFSDELMPEYEAEEQPAYFQLSFAGGQLLERSNSLGQKDLVPPEPPGSDPVHWTAALPDGRAGRFVSQLVEIHHVFPEEGPNRPRAAKVMIVVARGREELLAAESAVMLDCAVAALFMIGLIALIAWTAVGRALEPTERLASTLDAIQVEDLPECLDVGELPSELQPMADKTDALIQRVAKALERERRTTADIAHELRTPISEALIVAEVALREQPDAEGARAALGTLRDVAWRMGRSVSTLLKLARLEMGTEAFEQHEVCLGEIVEELLRSLSSLERERELVIENRVESKELVQGDRDVLRIVVSNLLSNALYYSPPRGTVECRLERLAEGWRLSVENEARDLQPADLRTLSEPFWRKDSARSDPNRSGLGLALSRALIQKTGGHMEFQLEDGRFRVVLTAPESTNGHPSQNPS